MDLSSFILQNYRVIASYTIHPTFTFVPSSYYAKKTGGLIDLQNEWYNNLPIFGIAIAKSLLVPFVTSIGTRKHRNYLHKHKNPRRGQIRSKTRRGHHDESLDGLEKAYR